ncbi:MAG: LPS-assembly protein LptD [Selenomonadaceae bacterium]|nr:LPS-assembly protein LptD [Selenomonadaceae bacterium]
MKKQGKILGQISFGALLVLTVLTGQGNAEYNADTDTGVDALDYIEERHRQERERALTEEQKELLRDVESMRANLRRPLATEAEDKKTADSSAPKTATPESDTKNDEGGEHGDKDAAKPKTKPLPIAFEGDDLTYYEATGDFVAKGKVDVLRLDATRLQSELITGNVKTEQVEVPDKVHVLRLTPGDVRVTLDGFRGRYNYGQRTGVLEDVVGKVDSQYITGKRFEFYPDHVVIYEGTQTKCGAKAPHYHVSAEKIEIWPNDKIKLYNSKFWLGKMLIAKKAYHEVNITPGAGTAVYPRIGYDNDDGLYLLYNHQIPLADHFTATGHFYVNTNQGIRSYADVTYRNRDNSARIEYGYLEDSDSSWVQKQPSFIYEYGKHFGGAPFSYNFSYELGRWQKEGVVSTHQRYGVGLARDPISFHKGFRLHLSTGYSITKESADNSKVQGFNWDALLTKDFDDKWAAFLGYHYAASNKETSLFKFNESDYARKVGTGVSWRVTDLDRLVVGVGYNAGANSIHDVDYYWHHDLHCSQVILRYRAKRDTWQIRWQFTPW